MSCPLQCSPIPAHIVRRCTHYTGSFAFFSRRAESRAGTAHRALARTLRVNHVCAPDPLCGPPRRIAVAGGRCCSTAAGREQHRRCSTSVAFRRRRRVGRCRCSHLACCAAVVVRGCDVGVGCNAHDEVAILALFAPRRASPAARRMCAASATSSALYTHSCLTLPFATSSFAGTCSAVRMIATTTSIRRASFTPSPSRLRSCCMGAATEVSRRQRYVAAR